MVSSNQLIEWVHLDDVECYELSLKCTDATIINYLLGGTHIIECSQVDNIAYFNKINEWINKPAHTDSTLELDWLLPEIGLSFWQ